MMGRFCEKCGADLSRPKRRHTCRKKKSNVPAVSTGQQLTIVKLPEVFWSVEKCEEAMNQLRRLQNPD